jgi:hypothetical protein
MDHPACQIFKFFHDIANKIMKSSYYAAADVSVVFGLSAEVRGDVVAGKDVPFPDNTPAGTLSRK